MPLTSNYPQTATYWSKNEVNEFDEVVFNAPVEIPVRWEQKNVLFMDDEGKQLNSNAIVYSLQEVDIEGYLALGSFSDLDPGDVDFAFEIKMQSIIKNLKGTKEVIKIWL